MKYLSYGLMAVFVIMVLLVGCAKKEEAKERVLAPGLEPYFVDANVYPKPEAQDTTKQSKADEMVTCAYDKMQMKKSAMEAQMQYKGKTLYFCTKDEMEKFKKDPEGYLSGKVKPN